MSFIVSLLRTFFSLLYHQFAWSYDLVAVTVSLGRWKKWVRTVFPYAQGRTLEIGFGPGHLQSWLGEEGHPIFGLDESRQMARQASRRLKRRGLPCRLTRGVAEALPFPPASFDSVVATFPSEYIFDPHTLQEVRRVLVPGGQFVILPTAWITGGNLPDRLAAWLFRFTGEAPGRPRSLPAQVVERFQQAGFQVSSHIEDLGTSQVLLVLARNLTVP